jgi:hypothetical protein
MNREQKRFLIAESVLAILGAAALIRAMTGDAGAHQAPSGWAYPPVCCNGNREHGDCQPIADRTVKPVAGGFRLTLAPGDHHMVTHAHVFDIPQSQAKPSPDGRYHVCLYPNEDRVQCFFAPTPGV